MAIQAETPAPGEHELPIEACRAQLALILDSADFDATGRERRFLSHVVEEALSGRGDRIKAYSIAVEVFGRGEAFDPQTDPIVRIEAGHLRRALERYYLTAGHTDPILITIPKGGYVPIFCFVRSLRCRCRRRWLFLKQPPTLRFGGLRSCCRRCLQPLSRLECRYWRGRGPLSGQARQKRPVCLLSRLTI